MQTITNLLQTQMFLPASQQTRLRQLSNSQTTEDTTDDVSSAVDSYLAWYNRPDNAVRRWREAYGIRMVRADNGMIYEYWPVADSSAMPSIYPDYFAHRTFDMFSLVPYGPGRPIAETALAMARRYADGYDTIKREYGGCGLYFYSHVKGSGKTFLSTILGAELSRRGRRVMWHGVVNLLQEIKSSFDAASGTSSSSIVSACKTAEVLILDDIGVERQSPWVNETVYSILDARLTHGRPTIFTSNVRPGELNYDERIRDRIARMSELVEMPEENVRLRLAATSRVKTFLRGGDAQ